MDEHDSGEVIESEVQALRYLVRVRIVEFQDWHTPPSSPEGGNGGGDDGSSDDSGDSNYNGFWPGLEESGGHGGRPRTTRYGGPSDPHLGSGAGPSFRPRQRHIIVVGSHACPVVSGPVRQLCLPTSGRIQGTDVQTGVAEQVDLACSRSPVNFRAPDPMAAVAVICNGQCAGAEMHGPPRDPSPSHAARSAAMGFVGRALAEDFTLMSGVVLSVVGPGTQAVSRYPSVPEAACLGSPTSAGPSSGSRPPVVQDVDIQAQEALGASELAVIPVAIVSATHTEHRPSLQSFISSLVKPLSQPIIPSAPRLRITKPARRAVQEDWVPRRSARLASKSKFREARPEKQARKILMRRLGFDRTSEVPDEASFQEFQELFAAPLSPTKIEAMVALFSTRISRSKPDGSDA